MSDQKQPTLDGLSRWLRELLDRTYCRITVINDHSEQLSVAAAAPPPRKGGFEWTPGALAGMSLAALPSACFGDKPVVLDPAAIRNAPEWFLPVEAAALEELVIAPIVAGDRLIGLLDFGECRGRHHAPFTGTERRDAAGAALDRALNVLDLAGKAAALAARVLESERRSQLLEQLESKLQELQPEAGTLWRETAHLGAELLSAAVGAVYLCPPGSDEFVLQARHGSDELTGRLVAACRRGDGFVAMVDPDHRPWRRWPDTGETPSPFTADAHPLSAALAVAIRGDGIEAVLVVADDAPRRQFTDVELDVLDRFARHAAQAYRRAHLNPENRQLAQFKILHQIDELTRDADTLDRVLHAALTGVTAGYGLRFNRAALLLLDEPGRTLRGRFAIGNVAWQAASADWQRDRQRGPQDFAGYLETARRAPMQPTRLHELVTQLALPIDGDGDALRAALESPALLLSATDFGRLPRKLRGVLEPDGQTMILLVRVMAARPLGLLIVDNRFTKESIGRDASDALMTFASAVAIAIDGFAARGDNEPVDAAVRAVAASHPSDDLGAVAQRIADEAARMCGAFRAVLWPYRQDGKRFELPVAAGLGDQLLVGHEPRAGIAQRVLEAGYVAVADVARDAQVNKGGDFLLGLGIASFEGVALRVGGEALGVLFVDHRYLRSFGEADRRRLVRFALHAALALKTARVTHRAHAAQRRLDVLANLGMPGDTEPWGLLEGLLARTFSDCATHARDMLGCDIVTLHVYNISTQTFEPQHHAGELIVPRPPSLELERESVIARWVMEQPEPVVIEDLEHHPVFGPTRFARDEKIQSCLAFPLRGDHVRVGALIANFHDRRCFTAEQLQRGTRCAAHVALAIENALQLRRNQFLVPVTSDLLRTASLQETLNYAAHKAATLLASQGTGALVAQVVLREDYDLVIRAVHGCETSLIGTSCATGEGSHAGLVASTRQVVVVTDYSAEHRFDCSDDVQRGFRSGLAVAMVDGADLIGVLEVRSTRPHWFGNSHQHLLSTLGVPVAMAIKSDQRLARARRGEGHLQALREAERSAERVRRGAVSREEVLRDLLRITVECYRSHSLGPTGNTFGTLFSFRPVDDTLRLEAVYPEEHEPQFLLAVGRERRLAARPIGITGRAAVDKQPQLVRDLRNHPDHLAVIDKTRSEIAAPILSGREVVGVLDVESDSLRMFDDRDIETLVTLAGFVAFALTNHGTQHIQRAAHDLSSSTSLSLERAYRLLTGADRLEPNALRGRLKDQVADLAFHDRLTQDIMAAAMVVNREPLQLQLRAVDDLVELVELVVGRFAEAASDKRITLDRTVLVRGSRKLWIDSDRIRQVLTNLVANAIKYSAPPGGVKVLVEYASTCRLAISVIDCGPHPPPPHELPRIFEPYYRASSDRNGREPGQGLGLSIARTLIDLHGGRIWAAHNEHGGLTLRFELDQAEEDQT